MRDAEIRGALDARLRLRFAGQVDTLIRHELGVCQGARRVDLAVINGHLDGWEIKSDVNCSTSRHVQPVPRRPEPGDKLTSS